MQRYEYEYREQKSKSFCARKLNSAYGVSELIADEDGALGTVEFLLLATLVVIGLLAGMVEYRDALVLEYGDASAALQSVNQSYSVDWNGDGDTADAGETFNDTIPASVLLDGNGISVNTSPAAEGAL